MSQGALVMAFSKTRNESACSRLTGKKVSIGEKMRRGENLVNKEKGECTPHFQTAF